MAAAAANALPSGARSGAARPGGQPRPAPQPRTLLAAGPALIASGDELVAAVWPYRRLALPRRLTVLPFAGLLYPAWLGAAAAGCWGWGSSWAQVPEAALLVLAAICLAHALTVLSGHWSVHAHCALTCTPVSARAGADLHRVGAPGGSQPAIVSLPIRPGPPIGWAWVPSRALDSSPVAQCGGPLLTCRASLARGLPLFGVPPRRCHLDRAR